MPSSIPIYILAGGRSRRMGTNKARLVVDGRPLLLHVAELLRPLASSLTVIGAHNREYEDLGLRTIADRHPGNGPLGGLDAALADMRPTRQWLLLCACDLAGLHPEWIGQLWQAKSAGLDCIHFQGEHIETLPALYRTTLRPEVTRRLEVGELALHSLIETTRARPLPLPPDWSAAININTPDDLETYKHQHRR